MGILVLLGKQANVQRSAEVYGKEEESGYCPGLNKEECFASLLRPSATGGSHVVAADRKFIPLYRRKASTKMAGSNLQGSTSSLYRLPMTSARQISRRAFVVGDHSFMALSYGT